MPRPPILPTIDFAEVFAAGVDYHTWLNGEEEAPNRDRMEGLRHSIVVSRARRAMIDNLDKPIHVLAIAEGWCGDVHRHVPIIMALAGASPMVTVRFIARATRTDVFARFLTNGGESVPKFVFLSDRFVECGSWGPMPEPLRRIIARGKAAGDVGAARQRVMKLYEADPNGELEQQELAELMAIASCTKP